MTSAPSLPTADGMTFDEFLVGLDDGEKADLLDGFVHLAPPDTRTNNSLMVFLACLIDGYTSARNAGGFTFLCRFACRIDDQNGVEPDVGYVPGERKHRVGDDFLLGGPDIAVEIVSRDSVQRDYGEKRDLYESAGVAEYWIIDPIQRRAVFLRLVDGAYESVPLEDNRIFRTAVIPGFWLDVEWLLAKQVPRGYLCLKKILASGGKRVRRKK